MPAIVTYPGGIRLPPIPAPPGPGYPSGMPSPASPPPEPGLCGACRHARRVVSARGSVFILCELSAVDPGFPKYPPLPVRACRGYRPEDGPET